MASTKVWIFVFVFACSLTSFYYRKRRAGKINERGSESIGKQQR